MTLHVFGDSWAAEVSEPETLYSAGHTDVEPVSVSKLIADQCGLDYECHARGGASIADMLIQLNNSGIREGDHAVFFLTSPSRRTYFNEHGQSKTLAVDLQPNYVNDHQDSWLAAVHCLAMQHICEQVGVEPWFVSTFNVNYTQLSPLWKHVERSYWLLPPETCVVRELFDLTWFGQWKTYSNSDFYDWLQSGSPGVSQFVRPCQDHPNMQGRRAMADLVVKNILRTL